MSTDYTPYELALLASCASPDTPDSAGARFLRRLASAAQEVAEEYRQNQTPEDDWDYNGELSELADSAVPIYTHELWSVFTDLAAYREDPTDLITGVDLKNLDKVACVCLYIIAERLVYEIIRDASPFEEN